MAVLDPTTYGGAASTGIFAVPWIPLLFWGMFVIALAAVVQHLRGEPIGPRALAKSLRSEFSWRSRAPLTVRLLWWLLFAVPFLTLSLMRDWDPLSSGEPFGPGPTVAEVKNDGMWQEDWIENAISFQTFPGPCVMECRGPRYIHRVRPGEAYTTLITIRNDGPIPVTLLGRKATSDLPVVYGLALLRDPANLSTEADNLRPFEPVSLAPGATVTLAHVRQASSCANPAADVTTWDRYAVAYPLVYDVLGWRRIGNVFPHFSDTVAGCD